MTTTKELLERLGEVAKTRNLYTCSGCMRLAYMNDPGDGIVTHFTVKEDGSVLESELE